MFYIYVTRWIIRALPGYTGGDIFRYGGRKETICGSFPGNSNQSGNENSIRYLGPLDTDESSISFYAEEYERGPEVTARTSPVNIPFHPRCLFATGAQASWTLYEEPNCTGNAVCYTPKSDIELIRVIDYTQIGVNTVRSVMRGCCVPKK